MAKNPGRPKLAEETCKITCTVPIPLRDAFNEKCQALGGGLASLVQRIWLGVVDRIPIETLQFLRSLATSRGVSESEIVLRWIESGANADRDPNEVAGIHGGD